MLPIFITVFAGLFGLAFGSFLNVCASRWPEEESIVKGRSHCRSCGRTLAWWENIPLASYIALRGRCRTCHASIGWRSPLVELAVGGLWAFEGWRVFQGTTDLALPIDVLCYQLSIALGMMVLLWLLVALAVLDLENLWLPDRLTWPGIVLGLLTTLIWLTALGKLNKTYFADMSISALPMTLSMESVTKLESFLGAVRFPGTGIPVLGPLLALLAAPILAAGIILLIRWVYWLVRRREGLGLGDAKLMAMLAAWLGLHGAWLAFSIGCVLGAIAALGMLALPRTPADGENWAMRKLPLGTFMCLGAIVTVLWGEQLIALYASWAGL